jgi:hypothetical protein
MAIVHSSHAPVTRAEIPWAVRQGALTGIYAGFVFAAYEMLVAAAMGMGFFMPLRMIGAILLGQAALDPTYSLVAAGVAGIVAHMMLAIVYGVAFALTVGGLRSRNAMTAAGAVFGFLLWVVNFYLIAPGAFPWFLDSPALVQFIGHTFFFGAALGWALFRAHEKFLKLKG